MPASLHFISSYFLYHICMLVNLLMEYELCINLSNIYILQQDCPNTGFSKRVSFLSCYLRLPVFLEPLSLLRFKSLLSPSCEWLQIFLPTFRSYWSKITKRKQEAYFFEGNVFWPDETNSTIPKPFNCLCACHEVSFVGPGFIPPRKCFSGFTTQCVLFY